MLPGVTVAGGPWPPPNRRGVTGADILSGPETSIYVRFDSNLLILLNLCGHHMYKLITLVPRNFFDNICHSYDTANFKSTFPNIGSSILHGP